MRETFSKLCWGDTIDRQGILLKWRALWRWLISGTNLLDINDVGWNLNGGRTWLTIDVETSNAIFIDTYIYSFFFFLFRRHGFNNTYQYIFYSHHILVIYYEHSTTQKTKDQTTDTLLKTGGKHRGYWRVSCFCSTTGICRVTLVTKLLISHEWGKNRIGITTNGIQKYPWSFLKQIFRNCLQSHSSYFNLTTKNHWFSSLLVISNTINDNICCLALMKHNLPYSRLLF